MKKVSLDIIKLTALALLAILMMLFIGSDLLVCAGDGDAQGDTGYNANIMLLGEGEQMTLEGFADGAQTAWLSSNPEVVSCVDGMLTAHQPGEAVISQAGGDTADYLRVTVEKTLSADVNALINKIAADGAELEELYAMVERAGRCTGAEAEALFELLGLLAECTDSSADTVALSDAAELIGMDTQNVLDAASFCWAAGKASNHSAVISFTGDVTIGRCNERSSGYYFPAVYSSQDSVTYPFDRVKRFFLYDDLTVINFEGVLTESKSNADKSFYFRGKPEYADILPQSGIEAATLANNHSMDYFSEGYNDTVKYLNSAGIATADEGQPVEYMIKTDDGHNVRVVVLAFNLIGNTRSSLDESSAALISKYKNDLDTVVVATVHWGTEYQQRPNADQISFGHALIDAGVDIVAGHHPHILQGIECYNGKYIAYSLGNFSFSGNTEARYPQTCILQAAVDYVSGHATVSEIMVIPCYTTSSGALINNYQPCVQYGDKSADIIALLLRRSSYTKNGAEEILWSGL